MVIPVISFWMWGHKWNWLPPIGLHVVEKMWLPACVHMQLHHKLIVLELLKAVVAQPSTQTHAHGSSPAARPGTVARHCGQALWSSLSCPPHRWPNHHLPPTERLWHQPQLLTCVYPLSSGMGLVQGWAGWMVQRERSEVWAHPEKSPVG